MNETIVWQSPNKKPKSLKEVLVKIGDVVDVGYWDSNEKCWGYGIEDGLYEEDESPQYHVKAWSLIPNGPKRKIISQ